MSENSVPPVERKTDSRIGDPEADHRTELNADLVQTDHTTSNMRWRALSDVDRNKHGRSTDAETGEDTTSVDQGHSSGTRCADHHGRSDEVEDEVGHERYSASKLVRSEAECDGADGSTGLV